jgi:hypothetical protein
VDTARATGAARSEGEIVYWFVVTSTPAGGAPDAIRDDWVGVVLPVRRPRPVEGPEPHVGRHIATRQTTFITDGVAVATGDALLSLRLFGRIEAAVWWETFFATRPTTTALVFRTWEGRLLPPSYAALRFPELEGFGSG